MKIIHCADLHLDSKLTSNLSKEQARERKNEILRTFTRMVDYAENNDVRAILIAGDLFDTRTISATARNLVRDTIIAHPAIDFFYLKGNHERDGFVSKLEEIPENLKLFTDSWRAYAYGDIVISGIEFTRENKSMVYNSLVLDHETYNIVMMHGQVTGYENKEQGDNISLDDLKNKGIDYLALGHLHQYQVNQLDARGIYCYSGCLEGRGFDECGEKGFVLLDIDDEKLTATCEFVPIAHRTLYTMFVDVTGVSSTQEVAKRIERELASKNYSSKSLVKIELVGKVDVDSEINCDYLQDMFSEYFYFEKVVDHTKLQVNYSDFEKDVSLKGEFIRMVLRSDLEDEQKSEIIHCGIQALSGEEI